MSAQGAVVNSCVVQLHIGDSGKEKLFFNRKKPPQNQAQKGQPSASTGWSQRKQQVLKLSDTKTPNFGTKISKLLSLFLKFINCGGHLEKSQHQMLLSNRKICRGL